MKMIVAKLEALYYLFMGVWPLLHLRSFEIITGTKIDKWLVKTIAWMFIVIGLQLGMSSNNNVGELAPLGIGIPAVIAGADIYYGLVRRRISRVYLLDVIPQAFFVLGWLVYIFNIR